MRFSTAILAAAVASLTSATVATVFIQPITNPETPPVLLAEISYDTTTPSTAETTGATAGPGIIPSEVTSYEAPELPEDAKLLRIGVWDAVAGKWVSSTSVLSVGNFGKGYSPHFVLSVDVGVGRDEVVSVAVRGVKIDAGQTRDFGPQAAVVVTGRGKQPELNRPVVLSPEGKKVAPEAEKTLLQKYWWVGAIAIFMLVSGGGDK